MTPELLVRFTPMVESALEGYFPESGLLQGSIFEAARYSLLAGGKRLRPALLLAFYAQCGGAPEHALPFACGLEMIHTYSLIHDDLPCMDDDDLRRGRPTSHRVYGEGMAVLTGDALLNRAFEVMLAVQNISAERVLACTAYIAKQSGVFGMIGGQVLDLRLEKEFEPSLLIPTAELKTAALLRAACVGGCLLAAADGEMVSAAEEYSQNLGLAFQIADDLLDVSGDPRKLGKQTNHDKEQGKRTFVSVYGTEGCAKLIAKHTDMAIIAAKVFPEPLPFITLARALAARDV